MITADEIRKRYRPNTDKLLRDIEMCIIRAASEGRQSITYFLDYKDLSVKSEILDALMLSGYRATVGVASDPRDNGSLLYIEWGY